MDFDKSLRNFLKLINKPTNFAYTETSLIKYSMTQNTHEYL